MMFEKWCALPLPKYVLNCSVSTLHIVPNVEIDFADGDITCNGGALFFVLLFDTSEDEI